MPEEVTYATLQFPNAIQLKTSQESYSLKRTGKSLYVGSDTQRRELFNYAGEFSSPSTQGSWTPKISITECQSVVKLLRQSLVLSVLFKL